MSESICFLLSRVLLFPFSSWFLFRDLQNHPLPFYSHPWEACPACKYSSHLLQNCSVGQLRRFQQRSSAQVNSAVNKLAITGQERRAGRGFWKRYWPNYDQLPYLNTLFIFFPHLQIILTPKVSVGLRIQTQGDQKLEPRLEPKPVSSNSEICWLDMEGLEITLQKTFQHTTQYFLL